MYFGISVEVREISKLSFSVILTSTYINRNFVIIMSPFIIYVCVSMVTFVIIKFRSLIFR